MEKKGNGKRVLAIIGIVFLVLVIGIILFLSLSKGMRQELRVKNIAGSFYKYYYEDNTDKKDKDKIKVFLSNYASSGLRVKLGDMETFIDTHKVENYNILKNCDKDKTSVIIYPKAPYGKKDYTVKVKMSCKK